MGPRRHHTWSGLQEAPELLRTRRVPELAQRLGLYLPDPLAGDREVLPDFFQRVLATVGEAEPEPQHLLLERREGVEDLVRLLPEREADDRLDGRDDLLVLDEVAQVAVLLLADRRLQRDGLLRDLQHLAHLVHGDVHLRRDLLRGGLAAEFLDELARGPDELVDRLDHVHGDADRAGLVGDGARDRLPDPPGRVGRKLITTPIFELIDRLHEADVAFLDEVEELQPAVRVLLGDGDDEPQVRLHHLLLRLRRLDLALPDDGHHALDLVGLGVGALLGELDLLLCNPDLLRLGRLELLGGPEVEVADLAVDGAHARVAERDVDEVLDLLGRGAPTVGPELDHTLGALDVVEEVAEPLHEPAAAGVSVLAVDDLVADVELAEVVEHLLLVPVGLDLEAPPRGLLALLRLLPATGLEPEFLGLGDEPIAVAEEPIHRAEGRDHLPPELILLLLGELLLVDVHDFLDGDLAALELLAQLAEALEGEVGREDGGGDLVLALLDPLGERDLAFARQEGDAAHLAQIEADRILGAADGTGRQVDRVGGAVVVGLLGRRRLALEIGRASCRERVS